MRFVVTLVLGLAASLAIPGVSQARVDVEAFPGEPFGVARITIPVSSFRGPVDLDRINVVERRGRAMYPAVTRGIVGKVLGDILGGVGVGIGEGQLGNVFVSFLYTGDEPLEITLRLPEEVRLTVVPSEPRRGKTPKDLLDKWWRDYTAHLQRAGENGDFPPLVQTYLTSMLAARLNLKPPLLATLGTSDSVASTETGRSLELLTGLERMHFGLLRETMSGHVDRRQPADRPLPAGWEQLPLALPKDLADVPVEPLAMHVPQESMYLRFGSFANSVWMDKLTDEYGALANMVTLRAYQKPIDARTQKQTAMERDPLGDLFGHTVIADVAMIGLDTFDEEGGSIGFILQAKNNVILGNNLRNMQAKRLKAEKDNGATLETIEIAGRKVAFASTPDNRLRSFYAQDGDFHLMTNNRAIVERFFECGEGKGSLGGSAEFRHARQLLPLERDYSVFAYFSTAFFQNLMGPHYQVEIKRRMQAVVDIEAVQLARLAARREGRPADTIEDLIAAGMLPAGFGKRPDGSGPIIVGDNVIDSLRGPRGFFIPVTDVKIDGITAEEERRVDSQLATLARDWKRMDPLMVGAKRTSLDNKGLERIVVDAHISPLDEMKYGWVLTLLGTPVDQMILPAPDDAISVQAYLKGGAILPSIGPHHLFVGIKDEAPPVQAGGDGGLFSILQALKETPGYLGAWPRPGYLDYLPLNLGGTATDASGFSRLLLGLWRWQGNGFSLLSFDRGLLAGTASNIKPVRAEVPAQIRAHIGNLSAMKVGAWVDDLSYERALAASQGNVRLMHLLTEQLGVTLGESKAVAERLLDGNLVCPLGGEFGISDDRGGGRWISTAWPQPGAPKPEFHSPMLKWFRGADFYLTRLDSGLFAHAELDMYRAPGGLPKIDLPVFNLFGGGQKAVKPAEDVKAPAPDGKPAPKVDPFDESKDPAGEDKSILKKPKQPDDLPPSPAAPGTKKGKREF